jgi:hypothetical protein
MTGSGSDSEATIWQGSVRLTALADIGSAPTAPSQM